MRNGKGQFIKGRVSDFKGKYHSEVARGKMRNSHLGKRHSEKTKQRISRANKGRTYKLTEEQRKHLSKAHKGLPGIKSMLGRKHSEETKKKMSLIKKGKSYPWLKGNKNRLGKKHTKESRLKIREAHFRFMKKSLQFKEPTSIEKTLYDYLLLKGLLFEKQRLINNRFLVDAYIPSLNLVIEADGKYWHSLDRVVKKDKAENAYLKKCGYSLVRLSENEIKSGKFMERMVFEN